MRWVGGARASSGSAASASQMGRFETRWLSRPKNLTALADLSGQWIDKVRRRRGLETVILDMDSSESPTYGEQEGSAYNGHFGCTCYHPLFVFNQFGDVERCALRPGNVHSADDWRAVLEPVIARYRGIVKYLYFRGDAAFANPEVYELWNGPPLNSGSVGCCRASEGGGIWRAKSRFWESIWARTAAAWLDWTQPERWWCGNACGRRAFLPSPARCRHA